MAFHMFNRRRAAVGIHFGQDWLTGVVLVRGGELIKRCDAVELSQFASPQAAAVKLVGRLSAEGGLVTANVDSREVFTRTIQLDADLDDSEIHEQVQLAATEALGAGLDGLAFDYLVQGISYAAEAKADVLLSACSIEVVRAQETLLSESGLKVRAIEPQEQSIQRAYCNMVQEFPDTHQQYVTAMISSSCEEFEVWLFRGRALEDSVRVPSNSSWKRLWEESGDTPASRSMATTETRMLCDLLQKESEKRLGERIVRWLILPSNISKGLADSLQEVETPRAIIEMRPNPDSDKANRIPSAGLIMAFGLALAGAAC